MAYTKRSVKAAINLIETAKKLIGNGHWAKGMFKAKRNGKNVYCAVGALAQARVNLHHKTSRSMVLARSILDDLAGGSILSFNDRFGVKARHIVTKMNAAVKVLTKQLQ